MKKAQTKRTARVAFWSPKGGSGKSTLALNFATACAATGLATVLLDLDPQGSSTRWATIRPSDAAQVAVQQIVATNATAMTEALVAGGADIIVYDLPPHTQASAQIVAALADIIVLPVQPSGFDILGLSPAVELLRKRPGMIEKAVCVVSMASPRLGGDKQVMEAQALVRDHFGLECIGVSFRRKGYVDASDVGLGIGEMYPDGKGALESSLLKDAILKRVGRA